MATLLVIGRSGQLARALAAAPAPRGLNVVCQGREAFDLAEIAMIAPRLAALAPAAVINAAAFNAVDKAEADDTEAMALNAHAVAALAQACARTDTPFVHVSTDYAFSGDKGAPYLEDDPTGPINAYGRSKVAGERAALAPGGRVAVVRTSWVHSAHGAGFVQTMARIARAGGAVDLVEDQHGRPTWAPDLADAALLIARALLDGAPDVAGRMFHYAGAGDATRADWGEHVLDCLAARGVARAASRRIPSTAFFAAAPRPLDTRLDCPRYLALPGAAPLRDWRDSVARSVAGMPRD